ncbi:hypothetical protein [Chryseobacterium shigense]|uniref:Lipoprotein n=1 Tax=Chryseobacterium shigense TaxID=297244 RepID=A0A841N368_9FLAO|nr:hypothetical protein [Chryseobacterium shigense]MBB6369171.1 hypothetical protein [Chryseobacterium shigense]
MKNYLIIILAILSIACIKTKKEITENTTNIKNKDDKPFREIGNSLLLTTKFAKKWYVQIYNEAEAMSKNDSLNQNNLEKLDFFDSMISKKIINLQYEKDLVDKNTSKIDSIFVIDSANLGNKKLFYVKSYKTIIEKGYDFPPTEKSIDLLVYKNNILFKKVNIYSDISYPFAKKINLGYLNTLGILYTKSFNIDEEGVNFLGEKQQDLNKLLK